MNYEYDQPVTVETKVANARHDAELHSVTMDPGVPLRARNVSTAVCGPLTDKKIEKYRREGYYSEAYREARRELWNKRRQRRDGNFLVRPDGTKVFSPM